MCLIRIGVASPPWLITPHCVDYTLRGLENTSFPGTSLPRSRLARAVLPLDPPDRNIFSAQTRGGGPVMPFRIALSTWCLNHSLEQPNARVSHCPGHYVFRSQSLVRYPPRDSLVPKRNNRQKIELHVEILEGHLGCMKSTHSVNAATWGR